MQDQISDNSDTQISLEELQKELSEAIAKAEENLNGWKLAQADFDNFRKRKEAESGEWINFGKHAAMVKMLPVLDSIEQSLIHAPEIEDEKYKNWKSGLEAMIKQLDSTMAEVGIQKIEAIGKKFDPNLHEAVKEVQGNEDGIVAEQYQTGFTLNGKLLRPAQVAITKTGDVSKATPSSSPLDTNKQNN